MRNKTVIPARPIKRRYFDADENEWRIEKIRQLKKREQFNVQVVVFVYNPIPSMRSLGVCISKDNVNEMTIKKINSLNFILTAPINISEITMAGGMSVSIVSVMDLTGPFSKIKREFEYNIKKDEGTFGIQLYNSFSFEKLLLAGESRYVLD